MANLKTIILSLSYGDEFLSIVEKTSRITGDKIEVIDNCISQMIKDSTLILLDGNLYSYPSTRNKIITLIGNQTMIINVLYHVAVYYIRIDYRLACVVIDKMIDDGVLVKADNVEDYNERVYGIDKKNLGVTKL